MMSKSKKKYFGKKPGPLSVSPNRLPVPITPPGPVTVPSYIDDPVRAYLAEVSQFPILTEEEEQSCAKKYRETGDIESARKLVTSHLRLVGRIALEYKRAYHNVLDLIQEGNVGLMKAAQKFDPDKGARFSYYASWWIRAYIIKYILDNFRLIKVGTTQAQRKLFFNLMKEKQKIEAQGFHADTKLLAERLDVHESEVQEMQKRMTQPDLSLETPLSGAEGPVLNDLLASTDNPEKSVAQQDLKNKLLERLDEFVKTLAPKEQRIFRERIMAEVPSTLEALGDEYGITRERVRQIESKIVTQLRNFFGNLTR